MKTGVLRFLQFTRFLKHKKYLQKLQYISFSDVCGAVDELRLSIEYKVIRPAIAAGRIFAQPGVIILQIDLQIFFWYTNKNYYALVCVMI